MNRNILKIANIQTEKGNRFVSMFKIDKNKIIPISIITIIILFSIFTITHNISQNTSFDMSRGNEINQAIDANNINKSGKRLGEICKISCVNIKYFRLSI